jgi:hypothetical protein
MGPRARSPPAHTAPDATSHPRTPVDDGPLQAGLSSACWRSPMLQQLIHDRFGVCYNIFYIAP